MDNRYKIGNVIYKESSPYSTVKVKYGWIWDIKDDVYIIKWDGVLDYTHWGRHHKIKHIDGMSDVRLAKDAEVALFTNFFKK